MGRAVSPILSDRSDDQRTSVIKDVQSMLQYYQALGFDSLPLSVKAMAGNVPLPGKKSELLHLKEEIGDCRRCKLSKGRKNIVFGCGSADARLMFIGEAPGKDEDMKGEPFVGEAGMLLTRLIDKMEYKRDAVYIVNIVKCRPPMDRYPEEDEIFCCMAFLDKQIDIIAPEFIITLGKTPLMALTGNDRSNITTARGDFFEYKGVPVMPTFHLDYLLLNPNDKWLTWADVQKVMERMNSSRP